MPFILKSKISAHSSLGVWHITESEEELRKSLRPDAAEKHYFSGFRNELRKNQGLACRLIIRELTGDPGIAVHYDKSGKPCLNNPALHISISHAGRFAAACLSDETPVGIDIELLKERISRVAERFLTDEEMDRIREPGRLEKLYVHWSAKEALYKYYGGELEDFQYGINLDPFDYLCSGIGSLTAKVRLKGTIRTHLLNYLKISGSMLVYTVGSSDTNENRT